MYRRVFILLTTVVVLFLAQAESAERYKIGVITPLSGEFASFGKIIQEGILKFADPQIQYIFEDESCAPARAVTAYRKLTDLDSVRFFIGPGCGSPQQAVAPLLKGKQQLVLLANSAPRDIYKISGGKVLSVQYAIEEESEYNAKKIAGMGFKKIVILSTENQFSQAHEVAFRSNFPGKVVRCVTFPTGDPTKIKELVLILKGLQFDALYVPDVFPFMIGLMTEMKKLNIRDKKVFSVYSAQSADLLAAEGKNADGLIYSYPDIGDQDAFGYFPGLAARIFADSILHCRGDVVCVKEYLLKEHKFSAAGTLQTPIVLKTIREGEFIKY